MHETHRALIVLVLVGLAVHGLAGRLQPAGIAPAHALRRGLWFALTVAAFMLGDFWLFAAVAAALLLWARGREENAPALFLALLFVVPPVEHPIPGLGLVNFLFALSLPRLLVLVLLLPLFIRLTRQPARAQPPWARRADLMFAGWLGVQLLLLDREESLTSALRAVFYLFVDLVVPYYVFSRAFDSVARLRDAIAALVVAGLLLCGAGIVEATRHWLLYSALVQGWGSSDQLLYLTRSGVLRAMASTSHAIALGYVLAVCLLLHLPLHAGLRPGWRRSALLVLLCVGLFCPLSRGPWLGAAAGLLLYAALGQRPAINLAAMGVTGACLLAVLPLLPYGAFVMDLVPFLGTVETGNIDYRRRLMENASTLIWRAPFLGASDYVDRLADMGMLQGQGIVDVVNTYVQVALGSGLIGLAFFGGVLAAALFAALAARRLAVRAKQREAAELGRSLAAAQLAVIVIIGSVSSILVIPWVYWCLTGMLVGYARVVQQAAREAPAASQALRFA